VSWGLLAACGASVGYGVATILQAVGSRRGGGLAAFRQPLVLGGLALDGACFLLSLVAFRRLPLVVVETVLAASLAVVVLAAHLVLRTALRRADLAAVGAVLAGLVVLVLASGEQPAARPGARFTAAALVLTAVLVLATVALYRRGPAWTLGLASALGYSAVAIGARAATAGGWVAMVRQPIALVVLAGGLVAVVAYVRALERGPVGLAAALVSVVEVVVPGVVGLAFLGDGVRAGWGVAALGGVVVALAGCVVLARSPGTAATGG